MRIEALHLRHFRSAVNIDLKTTADRIYIGGRNGAGKTNVKEALRWALRGVATETDARGLGWELMVPEASKATELSVGVDISNLAGITRLERAYEGRNRKLTVDGRGGELAATQAAVYEILQTDPIYLDAVLTTDYFGDLSHADAKAFVLSLLNVRIDIPGEGKALDLDQVETRYAEEFKKRTQAKADLRAHVVPAFTEPPDGIMPDVDEVVVKLKELRLALQEAVKASGNIEGQRAALRQEIGRVTATKEQAVWSNPPSVEALEAQAETIGRLRAELEDAIAELASTPVGPKKAKRGESVELIPISKLESVMNNLAAHKPSNGCVLDGNVPCETHKTKFNTRMKAIKAEIEERSAAAPVFEEPTQVDPLRETREALDGLVAAHAKGLKVHDEALAATAFNARRRSTLEALEARLAALVDDPAAVEAISTLETRIKNGEAFETRCREYWRGKQAFQVATEKHAKLEKDVARLEELVTLLGPKGAMMTALATAIETFERRINETTIPFGWQISFQMDPWLIRVNKRPLESYSKSQRFRIGVAIQIAVAALSKLGFVVIDELDILDKLNRQALSEILFQEIEGIEQIFILSTRDDDQPLPQSEALISYRLALQDGRTVVSEVTGA